MRILPRSLFGRLVVVQVVVAVLLAALLPLLISQLLTSTTNQFVGRELDRSAARVKPRIIYGPKGWAFTEPLPPMFDAKEGIRNAQLIDDKGQVQLDRGAHYSIPYRELPLGNTPARRLWQGMDVGTYPVVSNGHRGWLVISSDRRRPGSIVTNVATSFLQRFLWIVPATILCSLALTLLFLAQATRAIRKASRRAEEISARSLDVRFDANAVPHEVRPLVRAMNQALDRVEQSYTAQSEFAANVAHELRNPLATIACRIEEIPDLALRRRMTSALTDAAHVVDQLMMLARLGGEGPVLGQIDLRSIALEAVEQSAPRIFASGRSIEFKDLSLGSRARIEGNKGLARLSVDNLIDNAQRHTPPGTHIRVCLGPGPRMIVEMMGRESRAPIAPESRIGIGAPTTEGSMAPASAFPS
jgi:signal transduction histidine kinase